MSSNSIKFHYVGERGVNENSHVHLDNNNGTHLQIRLFKVIFFHEIFFSYIFINT